MRFSAARWLLGACAIGSASLGLASACGGHETHAPADASSSDGAALSETSADSPGDGGAIEAAVSFAIDTTRGPARQFQPQAGPQPVSPYVYGINADIGGNSASAYFTAAATRWGFVRQGGDSFTPWNWTNNYSSAASDFCFQQKPGNGGTTLAGVIISRGDTIPAAQARGEAFLATVPIADYVAAAFDNDNPACPTSASDCNGGTTSSVRVNSGGVPFASADGGGAAFVPNLPSKPGGAYCTCAPGAACDGGCAVATSPVYADELVSFLHGVYSGGGAPVFFSLDNEPNYWGGTHPELWPTTGALPCQTYTVTYDDIVGRDTAFARAIKAAWPGAKVFGPIVSADGMVYAHASADPPAPSEFLDYYLAQMAAASGDAGAPLLDVLDVHYYTNGLGTTASPSDAQCMQSPRLFWDPGYTSLSPSATDALDFGYSGINAYFDRAWYPRQLIPRIEAKIAAAYAGASTAAPGLSVTEYNNGCESAIAGGVAQADGLGVFGREGMFAAAAFPLQSLWNNYLVAAFDLYRGYDGHGAVVGDTAVLATTSDAVDTSVYAFTDSADPTALDLVILNKTSAALTAAIRVNDAQTFGHATAYQLVDGQAAVVPVSAATPVACAAGVCTFTYTMPSTSATTLVFGAGAGSGAAPPSFVKVDDMEGTRQSGPIELPVTAAGESPGDWFAYVSTTSALDTITPDPFSYTTLPAPHTTMPGVTSTRASHVQCALQDIDAVCQMGFPLATTGASAAPVDVSAYSGITFWARSDAGSAVDVLFRDVDTEPLGGRCGVTDASSDQCYDDFQQELAVTSDWRQYTVLFRTLHQAGAPFNWGYTPPSGAFDATQLYSVLFSVMNTSGAAIQADMWIDDVYLVKGF